MNVAEYRAERRFEMREKKVLKGVVAAALILVVIAVSGFFPLDLEARVGLCEEALGRCAMDAAVAGLMGGAHAFGAYAAGCVLGYSWCLDYY